MDVDDFRLLPSPSEAIDPAFFQGINITNGIDPVLDLHDLIGDA